MISSNFTKSKRGGPQKVIKASANNSVIFKPKIQVRVFFFNQKNKWNQGVKSNFEKFGFWVELIPKFALVRALFHQF